MNWSRLVSFFLDPKHRKHQTEPNFNSTTSTSNSCWHVVMIIFLKKTAQNYKCVYKTQSLLMKSKLLDYLQKKKQSWQHITSVSQLNIDKGPTVVSTGYCVRIPSTDYTRSDWGHKIPDDGVQSLDLIGAFQDMNRIRDLLATLSWQQLRSAMEHGHNKNDIKESIN